MPYGTNSSTVVVALLHKCRGSIPSPFHEILAREMKVHIIAFIVDVNELTCDSVYDII